jgi:hypothetical protein
MQLNIQRSTFLSPVYLLSTLFLLLCFSCKKDEVTPQPTTPAPPPATELANIEVEFNNTIDDSLLVFGKKYLNPMGDTFTVNKFNYYISNIVLVKEDNSLFTQTESYYLIEQSKPESKKLSIGSVPVGKYKSIRFLLGIDSARNVSGAQTGALDPAKGMFWNWNTGYIMLKLEGAAPTSTAMGFIEYHLGGFKGVNKVQRSFDLAFSPLVFEVTKSKTSKLRLQTNVNELFQSPNQISFSAYPVIASAGANAKMMADNSQNMITFKAIE